MNASVRPVAVIAADVEPRKLPSGYPAPFVPLVQGRQKRVLGDLFGLANFGVNLTRILPGSMSALLHSHARQDEFVYILEGEPTLVTEDGERQLAPGHCAGFKAGTGLAHHLVNRTDRDVVYLEIGDRTPGDSVHYPNDDMRAEFNDGRWRFLHRDGTPYV
jgi:uncharacterized cupin superfamily protein